MAVYAVTRGDTASILSVERATIRAAINRLVTLILLALVQEVALVLTHCLIQNIASHEWLLLSVTATNSNGARPILPLSRFLLWHAHVDIVGDIDSRLLCLLLLLLVLSGFALIALLG